MSSRATQGLQVLLIVSIMLNVVLGVTTYLYSKQAFEKINAAAAADERTKKAEKDKTDAEAKFDRAKKIIGYADLDIDALEAKNQDDQQTFGFAAKAAAAPAEGEQKQPNVIGYQLMVSQLAKMRDDLSTELKRVKNDYNSLEITFKNREAAKDNAIHAVDAGFKDLEKTIVKNEEDARSRAAEMVTTEKNVIGRFKTTQDANNQKLAQATAMADRLGKALKEKDAEIDPLVQQVHKFERKEMDIPSGEINWVSLPTKTVWIDRGRADYLPRGIRFTVYSPESNTAVRAIQKGTVEVTRIVADHQAECRIVDDKFGDPITPGDKIFNALWAPGQQLHFALNGVMNLDGDGRNQIGEAIALVTSYGGVVDCWLDNQGRRQGKITVSTQYIVNGDAPSTGVAEMTKNYKAINDEAKRYQLHDWTLADFKQRTNYQKTNFVENFGAGAAPSNAGSATPAAKPAQKPVSKKAPATKVEDEFK